MNTSITKKNLRRKPKPTFDTFYDLDPAVLGVAELHIIVSSLSPEYEDVAAVKATKMSKADLVLAAYALLPSVSVLARRLTLREVFGEVLPSLRTDIAEFARDAPEQAQAPVSADEQEVLDKLVVLEGKKSQKLTKNLHKAPFLAVHKLNPEKLSVPQIKLTLRFLGLPLTDEPQAALRDALELDAIEELRRALVQAVGLVSASAAGYVSTQNNLTRLVNQHYGPYPEIWKVWWVSRGLMNYSRHCLDDHALCGDFVWFGRCSNDEPEAHVPKRAYWSQSTPPQSPYGTPELAALLCDAWTVGKYVNDTLRSTILYMRSCACESFMHAFALRAPKFAHFTTRTYRRAMWCTVLAWNEQRRSKQLAPAVVRSTKHHPDGVLEQRQHRPQQQAWLLDVMEQCLPPHQVSVWVARQRARMLAAHERRGKLVALLRVKHTAMVAAREQLAPGAQGLLTGVVDPYPLLQPEMVLVCDDSVHYAPSRPFGSKWMKPPHPLTPTCDALRVREAAEAQLAVQEEEENEAEPDDDSATMRMLFADGADAGFSLLSLWPEEGEDA